MKRQIVWPCIIMASAVAASLGAAGYLGAPFRPLAAFWFLGVCPGMAFVRLLRVRDRLTEWVLAIALSLALNVLVSEAFILVNFWSAALALVVLIGLSLLGAALQLAQIRRAARADSA